MQNKYCKNRRATFGRAAVLIAFRIKKTGTIDSCLRQLSSALRCVPPQVITVVIGVVDHRKQNQDNQQEHDS